MLAGRGSGRALSSCATWALSMLSVAMSEAAEPLFDQPVCAGCALVRPKPFAMPRGPYPPPREIQFEKSEAFRAVTQGFVSENNNRRFDAPFVVPAHQLVFCKVAKVASSGWLRLLRRMEGHADWQRNPYFLSHRHYVGGVRQMSHLSNAEALRVLRDRANWTRVVIVRDPAERLLSAYLDKIHGQRDTRAQNAIYSKVLFGLAPQEFANVTFGDFVERVEYGLAHGIVDQHWSPLADNCDLRTWLPAYDLVINMRKGDDMSKLLDCAQHRRATLQQPAHACGNARHFQPDIRGGICACDQGGAAVLHTGVAAPRNGYVRGRLRSLRPAEADPLAAIGRLGPGGQRAPRCTFVNVRPIHQTSSLLPFSMPSNPGGEVGLVADDAQGRAAAPDR